MPVHQLFSIGVYNHYLDGYYNFNTLIKRNPVDVKRVLVGFLGCVCTEVKLSLGKGCVWCQPKSLKEEETQSLLA